MYLDPLLHEINLEGELLPQKDVRVMRSLEGLFELLQLVLREDGSVAALPLARWPRRRRGCPPPPGAFLAPTPARPHVCACARSREPLA